MENARDLVTCIFKQMGMAVAPAHESLFDRFLAEERTRALIDVVTQTGNMLMAGWTTEQRIEEIRQMPLRIPNATVGKPYDVPFDAAALVGADLTDHTFSGLQEVGLNYNAAAKKIHGIPTQSGDLKLVFRFKVAGQPEDAAPAEKMLVLTVNPDPRTLWKTLDSDQNDPYWKEDNVTVFAPLGNRHILASSKRGRSHANVGSFREDDFAFAALQNGWNVVVVSDGAGSARLSRKGSAIACTEVVAYFNDTATAGEPAVFDAILQQYHETQNADTEKELNKFVYNYLGKAAFHVHKQLQAFAGQQGAPLKDLSCTLIFTLWKKYDIGYAFLSFGVGDCPIAILNKDITEVTLMNWIDVGEFGGGTRFITMPEIFSSGQFATRFGFKLMPDFSYLIMMSDGIYDPKFVVEAALPNIAKWQEFLADLNGNNEEGIQVELNAEATGIEQQLSRWMDFWSPGNHDDRTLAIVF